MKKLFLPCLLTLLLGLVLGLLYNFFALSGTGLLTTQAKVTTVPAVTIATAPLSTAVTPADNARLLEQGTAVLEAVKAGDFAALSKTVHPERGVTLTPFSTVGEDDVVLTTQELSAAGESSTTYHWGLRHGPDAKIDLSVRDFFARYVFPVDYTAAPLIGVNYISAAGNSLENVVEAYPDDSFVEYYFPGKNPKDGGRDWSALKLVFGAHGDALKLVGIIHSEWTV